MAQTAPMPAGFPAAALDADTLPPAPVEAEAAPPAPGSRADREPVRRPLPQSGYLDASPAALRTLAEGEARIRAMAGPGIKHAATIAAEVAEREAAAEIERQARNPRAVWRQSLALESEALAEVDRLAPLIERAGELVRDLESRHRANAATVAAGDDAATARLIEALQAGETSTPAPSQVDVAEAEAIAAELRTARAALAQLERQSTAAAERLDRCKAGVSRCAYAVLVDIGADMAAEILDRAAELETCRADLDALSRLLTAEHRRLNGFPARLPASISAALYPPDAQLAGRTRAPSTVDLAGEIRRIATRRGSPGRCIPRGCGEFRGSRFRGCKPDPWRTRSRPRRPKLFGRLTVSRAPC